MKNRYKATFADGSEVTRTSARAYAFAWRVTGTWNDKPGDCSGFAASYDLARKASAVYLAPGAYWVNPVVEIVPAVIL
jgi:hypothetical protein